MLLYNKKSDFEDWSVTELLHLSIAICDDDINVQFAIEQYLKDIFNEYAIDADIDCYGSGEELCDHFEKGKFDL